MFVQNIGSKVSYFWKLFKGPCGGLILKRILERDYDILCFFIFVKGALFFLFEKLTTMILLNKKFSYLKT